MSSHSNQLQVGDVTVVHEQTGVGIFIDGDRVGKISAAGLTDAARMDDELLSQLGGLYHAVEDDN